MQLPDNLERAIDLELSRIDLKLLLQATAQLSDLYREVPASRTKPFISTEALRLAYIAVRFPAIYAVITRVLLEIKNIVPDFEPHSLLDLGAGPGTVMWSAAEVFETLEQITLIEVDSSLISLGKRLAQNAEHREIKEAVWSNVDLKQLPELPPQDLIVMSYSLGELDPPAAAVLVRKAWEAAQSAVVIVEPGTPKGFACIREARGELISLGGHVVAPCPHALACPMSGGDWCHFAQRVQRTSIHRRAKLGTMSYEDEKFSYFVAAKFPVEPVQSRIIRHPLKREGHVRLELCTPDGLKRETVSRKMKEAYKRARKAEWGSPWEYELDRNSDSS